MTGSPSTIGHDTARRSTPQQVKNAFDNIYDQALPDAYFSALRPLEYRMPHFAQPIFRRAARMIAEARSRAPVRMLDLCCGYGVNGMLATHRLEMEQLYDRFRRKMPAGDDEIARRLEADRAFFASRRFADPLVRVAGVDVAGRALDYARSTGLVERTVHLNLEEESPEGDAVRTLAGADLITVTGGLSYIGAETIRKVLSLYPRSRLPWIIAFPLRHTDFSACETTFERFGLQVETWPHRAFPHRRFEDADERRRVLAAIDVETDALSGPPSHTQLEAVLYVAVPPEEAEEFSARDLLHPATEPDHMVRALRQSGEIG
jgi:hypothetical protein